MHGQLYSPNKFVLFRSWEKVCVVLKGSRISFYKDQKSYRTAPDVTYRGEQTIDVVGGKAEVASDYTKKKHVFRLRSVDSLRVPPQLPDSFP